MSIKSSWLMSVNGIVWFFYTLADFLPTYYTNYLGKSISVSLYKYGFVYFSFQIYQCLLHIYFNYVVRYIHILYSHVFLVS